MRRNAIRLLAAALAVVMLACQAGLAVRGAADAGTLHSAEEETAGSGEIVAGDDGGYLNLNRPRTPMRTTCL